MDSPEYGRSDVKGGKFGDDDDLDGSDKRKHRSSRSKKSGNGEDSEVLDGNGRRKSYGDRNEGRKRSGGSNRADSDEEDYDMRKELRSKQTKKKQEESSLEKLSSWYQDGESENKQDGGEKSGSRTQTRSEDAERRKFVTKIPEHESSQSRSKSKEEKSCDGEIEKNLDRDYRHSDRRESGREKGHGSSEHVRSSRRRWDDSGVVQKVEESYHDKVDSKSGKSADIKHESSRERGTSATKETSEGRNKGLDYNSERGINSSNKEERRSEVQMSKGRGRSDGLEEDNKDSPVFREDKSGREKSEKHKQQRTPTGRDVSESRDRSYNTDEDGNAWSRDKGGREVGNTSRSRTPEKIRRHHQGSEHSDMDYENSLSLKRKDLENDGYRDDRSKGRDDTWSERSREREGSKENWKRRQNSGDDKDPRNGDIVFDHSREWEMPRYGRERADSERHNERPLGRSGNRKDGNRGEAVKTSSNFGISNENYDVIEIQTKPIDYGRTESGSNFTKRTDVGKQSEAKSVPNDEEWSHPNDDRAKGADMYGPGRPGDNLKERYLQDGTSSRDPNSWRDDFDVNGGKAWSQKGAESGRNAGGQSFTSGSQPPFGGQEPGSFNRAAIQGVKGGRTGRGGRGRSTGRDSQPTGISLPLMGSPFVPLGMPPPGPIQPLNPSMSPAPGPPISMGVFIPPFSPPVWPGSRGVDMNMIGAPPGLSSVPPGSSGPRYPLNMGNPANAAMYFNQSGPGRGVPPSISGSGFSAAGSVGRGISADKTSGGWVPPKGGGLPGKAPSRGEQNDYSQNFVDTGMRPQNFIRELELTNVVEDYPKLRELIQKKDEIVANSASPPMYYKCDLKEIELSPEFFGTKFDVILIDPPWEEYVHRAPGVADHMEYWTFEEIMNLKIEAIADTPSFIFLWVGDGVGLEQGRQCLKKWGFRRCEDICWVKTNKTNATPGLRHDSHTLFQHSKEHCLMGIKGTVRRSTDGHIIHANIDTDVIIAEEPPYGSTQKPEDMYRIIEHFALGCRRLELFGEDHNIRSGWMTVGKGLSSTNFNAEAYIQNFADKDGKVWQGGGGRNPPPDAPHLVLTTPEIEALRPKSPMKNQQQQQSSISLTTSNSSNRRAAGNSPQNPTGFSINQEASGSNPSTPAPWASSPMEGFNSREGCNLPSDDKVFDMYAYSGQVNGDFL